MDFIEYLLYNRQLCCRVLLEELWVLKSGTHLKLIKCEKTQMWLFLLTLLSFFSEILQHDAMRTSDRRTSLSVLYFLLIKSAE